MLYLVVDGARARWFELKGARLQEHPALVNPEHRLPEHERYTESKPGRRDGPQGLQQSFDDHRRAHDKETERRFARLIAETLRKRYPEAEEVVLVCADPMLGLLRPELGDLESQGVSLTEVEKNWGRWKVHEIQDALAERSLVAARPRRGLAEA